MVRALIVLTFCVHYAHFWTLPLPKSLLDMIDSGATNVKFFLYTNQTPTEPQQLLVNDENSIKNSYFEKSRDTKFIIHGWGGSFLTSSNCEIRQAYLSKNNYNIIAVDWNAYSKLNYLSAHSTVPAVGKGVAEFIDFLNEKFELNFDKLVVIGHSLGAHVAGFTGKNVKRGKIAAIVGLDPAYPLYSYEDSTTRLSSNDAKYVQTIQTNANVKGFLKPIGSAAFYPNWGRSQPGCGTDTEGKCAHNRCVIYYAEAVRGYSFAPVYKCSNIDNIANKNGCNNVDAVAEIGDPLEIQRVNGIYFFETTDKQPFGHQGNRTVIL